MYGAYCIVLYKLFGKYTSELGGLRLIQAFIVMGFLVIVMMILPVFKDLLISVLAAIFFYLIPVFYYYFKWNNAELNVATEQFRSRPKWVKLIFLSFIWLVFIFPILIFLAIITDKIIC
ncbi:hypothetical protein [Pedobacter sp. Leaf176]|uniref:hypothetical protein n=1 Tax=Pedobacter sp. Leaf176 TaxID=1736286 RepID=UPI0006FB591F|nr:hypothetical protein [Pedobacter sp. Leaf176]KQR65221.1 hypothetical protein ASF92_20005 [Pedobacter sp. Leaf176]